jgi:hypothetical protein
MSEAMPGSIDSVVRAECRTFTVYLTGNEPDELVVVSYARGLASDAFGRRSGDPSLDRALIGLARRGPFATGLTDAWARIFTPAGGLRRRLVLLVAILESTTPAYHAFEPAARGRIVAFAALLVTGLGFLTRLVVAVPVVAIARWLQSTPADDAAAAGAHSGTTP